MSRSNDDSCPYSAQLVHGVGSCARFEPLAFLARDFNGRPLAKHLTCRHLDVGGASPVAGPWYPRCLLGGPLDFAAAVDDDDGEQVA